MRVKLILPALTEVTSPFFRPVKYSLFPPLGLATLAGFLHPDDEVGAPKASHWSAATESREVARTFTVRRQRWHVPKLTFAGLDVPRVSLASMLSWAMALRQVISAQRLCRRSALPLRATSTSAQTSRPKRSKSSAIALAAHSVSPTRGCGSSSPGAGLGRRRCAPRPRSRPPSGCARPARTPGNAPPAGSRTRS